MWPMRCRECIMLKSEPDLSNIVIVVMGVGGGGNQDVIYFTDTDTDDGDIVLSR